MSTEIVAWSQKPLRCWLLAQQPSSFHPADANQLFDCSFAPWVCCKPRMHRARENPPACFCGVAGQVQTLDFSDSLGVQPRFFPAAPSAPRSPCLPVSSSPWCSRSPHDTAGTEHVVQISWSPGGRRRIGTIVNRGMGLGIVILSNLTHGMGKGMVY